MPIKTDREYRRIDLRGLEVRSAEEGGQTVEGYACTFNQPYELWDDGEYRVIEQIDPHAFDACDMSDVIMQYDHEGRVFARMSNGTLVLRVDEHGLHMRADLSGTEIGRQLYQEIRDGYTDKMSFGFRVEPGTDTIEEHRDAEADRRVILRTITRIKKLYDVSAVSLPANDATEITATRSFCDGVIAEAMEERHALEERERKIKVIKTLLEV